jgi:hypothetical protein
MCAALDIHDNVNDGRIDNQPEHEIEHHYKNIQDQTNKSKGNDDTHEPTIHRGNDSSDSLRRFTIVWGDVISNVSDARHTDSGHGHILNAKFVVNDLDDGGNTVCSTRGARDNGILGFVRTEVDAKDKHGPTSDNPTFLAPPIKWATALVSHQYHYFRQSSLNFVVKHPCSTLLKSLVDIRPRNIYSRLDNTVSAN